jgi:MYXO-CTERM domain-containing protein
VGTGTLLLDVAVVGAEVNAGDGDVWLQGDAGSLLHVSGLVAWDADGAPLDARFVRTAEGFRVAVDDSHARYPVEIDPLYGTVSTTLTGADAYDYFGRSVSDAGDVNGDGYDDVVVGAQGTGSSAGWAYVYLGSASGVSSTAATTLTGEGTGTSFGRAVSGAGDVNGDGYDDVIVGACYYGGSTGKVYVYLGSAHGVSSTAATTITGDTTSTYNYLGQTVSSAGDVDHDGYDDVIIGAPGYSSSRGRAFVHHGSATGLATTATTTLTGSATYRYLGTSVSDAGDVNGDGYDDVIVGELIWSTYIGDAKIYLGSATGVSTTAATTLAGETSSSRFGQSVSGAGDVNGDGYDDVIVGAYGYASTTGRAYVYMGSATGVDTTADTTLDAESSGDWFGYCVSGAGDINGDGYADVIVGAQEADGSVGRAYVYEGSASGIPTTASSTVDGPSVGTNFAMSVSGAGDVDGDGADDVIVGNDMAGGPPGEAYVYAGIADADGDGYDTSTDCDDTDATAHPGGTEICDAADADEDCSGFADDLDAAVTGQTAYYVDDDGDGYGTAVTTLFCDLPATGYAAVGGDCDDTEAGTNPGAAEVCDAADVDEDCDGASDDADTSASGQSPFYVDSDGDGYGGTTAGMYCDLPSGYAVDSTDCDDEEAAANPGATEVCDAADLDEDCDGLADDRDGAAVGGTLFYADTDGDGYGGAFGAAYCDLPSGYAADSSDCDDAASTVNPGALEVCDALDTDEDCDGLADDADGSATGQATFYVDGDADGYGGATTGAFCDLPSGYSVDSTDCDDGAPTYHPGADESDCTDPHDYDCNGSVAFVDADGDSFAACVDCNDAEVAIHPGAEDAVGDGVDGDCDGVEHCYVDADGDGYTLDDPALVEATTADCLGDGEAPAGTPDGDCDDEDAAYNPGAEESDCTDPADYNCDGSVGYTDADGDGFAACAECDDGDPAVNAEAEELCNGIDDDCNGALDGGANDEQDCDVQDDTGAGTDDGAGSCGCATTGTGSAGWLLGGLLVLAARRRSRG